MTTLLTWSFMWSQPTRDKNGHIRYYEGALENKMFNNALDKYSIPAILAIHRRFFLN